MSPRDRAGSGRGRSGWNASLRGAAAILLACSLGCPGDSETGTQAGTPNQKPPPTAKPPSAPDPDPVPKTHAELVQAGRSVYNANCIACHSVNPAQDGALGPAVAGSSRELIEARVVRGDYPEGYSPKRQTRVMVPLPHLEPRIDDLEAYLGSLEES